MNTEKSKNEHGKRMNKVEALVEKGKLEMMAFMDDLQGLCFTASKNDKEHLRGAIRHVQVMLHAQNNLLGAMEKLLLDGGE